ncbi:carbohydrate ABC transporter permease [Paenibacillus macquariensis]|uniref:Aldouronate transport system permease protein n=1 Tax=Paenibacillus macquariensis TaxID=948756 RepID=A0ABY1JKU9_9BACL|nr:carbohydrate ABC transporter permease [Paenibacillus macquariensis]MEC0090016.1 carbohydrate ABC transporter permease [Paenibacillus macquariensis]OAB31100.1 sugar ABC transporter permease [Paenibacillus macquariensis subsp. macquariensis]SIQ36155.1 putative aldouronate transport system permease protein [Paenibacillus macquariensis]
MVRIRSYRLSRLPIHLFFIAVSAVFIVPLWSIIAISLSNELDISNFGYHLIPKKIDFQAYHYIFDNPMTIVNAYKVTAITSVIGTLLSVIMISMCAYALSRSDFKYSKIITFYLFFTTLFSGGIVPFYILMTKFLHLQNTYAALIIPLLGNIWYMFLMRTFFKQLPDSLVESAKIDGAGELRIYITMIVPLSTPVLATVGLMQLLIYWNSWFNALLFIDKQSLYPLQYLLQVMMSNIQEILRNMTSGGQVDATMLANLPTESTRMAMCILAIAPMLFVFPFFQKYFAKGLTVGAVKG